MNRYFARLAQRTEVAPRTARSGDAAAPTIVEQHREVVIAPPQPATPAATEPVNDAASIVTTMAAPPPPLTKQIDPHAVTVASRPVSASARANDARNPSAVAKPPVSTPTINSVATPVAAPAAAPAAAPFEATDDAAIPAPIAPNSQVATATSAPLISAPETTARLGAAPSAMTLSGDDTAAPDTGRHTVSDTASPATVRAREYNAARAFTASRVAAPHHAPASAPSSSRQRSAEVHVHIGKIELEVRAPSPAPVKAPAFTSPPPRAAVPAVPRAPRFNAHRHYLRGG